MDVRFAPMEGLTDSILRRVQHRCFGGVSRYYIPFVTPTVHHVFTPKELRQILPEENEGMDAVPQLLARDPEHFLWAAGELQAMGYQEVNLNLGCPSGTVTAKGRGAGMLRDPQGMTAFLDAIIDRCPIAISIKTRIGFDSPEEWPDILAIYRRYPMKELIIHPRTRRDFYKGALHPETFRAAYEAGLPVVYNGDLFDLEACERLQQEYPGMPMMLGRGLVANPALGRQLQGGEGLTVPALRAFHDQLYAAYAARYPAHQAHGRMRDVMTGVACCFEDVEKPLKALRKSTPETYPEAVERLLSCQLRPNPGYIP